mmetsp:Transcript_47155/g.153047  ORF Transcript_47155/g.153047 Transcript_47155/m.153047 type:complete len:225 (-) Transcript_47155:3-677(-)
MQQRAEHCELRVEHAEHLVELRVHLELQRVRLLHLQRDLGEQRVLEALPREERVVRHRRHLDTHLEVREPVGGRRREQLAHEIDRGLGLGGGERRRLAVREAVERRLAPLAQRAHVLRRHVVLCAAPGIRRAARRGRARVGREGRGGRGEGEVERRGRGARGGWRTSWLVWKSDLPKHMWKSTQPRDQRSYATLALLYSASSLGSSAPLSEVARRSTRAISGGQ